MRCPWCGRVEDKVVDSRSAERGDAIRRRRQCLSCGRRFTTYERVEVALVVVKRDGSTEPWSREKMVAGIRKALVNRPVTEEQISRLVTRIEGRLRRKGPRIRSQQIGLEVLSGLQRLDQVAYVRFASVYKDFQEVGDFERELGLLLQKKESKGRSS